MDRERQVKYCPVFGIPTPTPITLPLPQILPSEPNEGDEPTEMHIPHS